MNELGNGQNMTKYHKTGHREQKMPFQGFLKRHWGKKELSGELLFVVACTEFFFYIFNGVTHCGEAFSIVIGDLGVEGVFQSHDQFDDVQGVCAKVFNEFGFRFDLLFLTLELLDDNFNDAFTIL